VKRLCLLLIFVNVVGFFWGMTVGQQDSIRGAGTTLSELDGLEKLSLWTREEALRGDIAKPVESVVDKVDIPLMESCFIIKNMVSESDAAELLSLLQAGGLDVWLSSKLVKEEFWLVHARANTWEQSLRDVDSLKAKGVVDLWLVPSGADKGVISLGLFATKARAEERLKQLRDKQISATIRLRPTHRYAVMLKWLGDITQLRSHLEALKSELQNTMKKINC